jgi:protein-L-isoaspartate(D-aspartate) O-methyltransferase
MEKRSEIRKEEIEIFIDRVVRPVTKNPLIIKAFKIVDRREFVPKESVREAYEDKAITLAEFSSISMPSVVAKMVDCLELTGKEKVLEIGTASGFCAAIVSKCASAVYTMEIDKKLVDESSKRLRDLGYENVFVSERDGGLGLPNQAPFDAIIVTASVKSIPPTLISQLKEGGRIIIPVGERNYYNSNLIKGIKTGNQMSLLDVGNWRFYPLISLCEGGWSEDEAKANKRMGPVNTYVSLTW